MRVAIWHMAALTACLVEAFSVSSQYKRRTGHVACPAVFEAYDSAAVGCPKVLVFPGIDGTVRRVS